MAHSVIITTPMPTLDEIGKELGLTRAEQDFLIRLVDEKGSRRREVHAPKSRSASSRTTKTVANKKAGPARKTRNRATASA
jgi:hypothetical protein